MQGTIEMSDPLGVGNTNVNNVLLSSKVINATLVPEVVISATSLPAP